MLLPYPMAEYRFVLRGFSCKAELGREHRSQFRQHRLIAINEITGLLWLTVYALSKFQLDFNASK